MTAWWRIRSRRRSGPVRPRPGTRTVSRSVRRSSCPPSDHVPDVPSSSRASSSPSSRPGPARPARPAGGRSVAHLVVRAARLHRAWMVLGIPTGHGIVVALLDEEPLLAPVVAPPDEREAAAQLVAVEGQVEIAARDLVERVVAFGQRPRSPVPHDDVAAPVLAGRDDSLEVVVVERVILDVDGQSPRRGVEGRALRYGPADEHTAGFEADVVVQLAGPVALDDEAPTVRRRRRGAGGLGGDREVALGAVVAQSLVGGLATARHRSRSSRAGERRRVRSRRRRRRECDRADR